MPEDKTEEGTKEKPEDKTDPNVPEEEGTEDKTEEPKATSDPKPAGQTDEWFAEGETQSSGKGESVPQNELLYDKELNDEHRKLQSRGWKAWAVGAALVLGLCALVGYITYSLAKSDKKKPSSAAGATTPSPSKAKPAAGATTPAPGKTEPAAGATTPPPGKTEPAAGATTPPPGKTEPAAGATTPPPSPSARPPVVHMVSMGWKAYPKRAMHCASNKHADFTLLVFEKGTGFYYDGCYLKPKRLIKKPRAGAHVPFHVAFNIHDPNNQLDVTGFKESVLPLNRFVNNKHLRVWRIPRRILRLYMKEYCGNVAVASNDRPVRRRTYRRARRSSGSGNGNLRGRVKHLEGAVARNTAKIDKVENTVDKVVLPKLTRHSDTITALLEANKKMARRLQPLRR